MDDYFKKLYSLDPLFRALVHAKMRESDESMSEDEISKGEWLSPEDEIEVLREYAITLFKEHRNLKNMFVETVRVSTKSVGLKRQQPPRTSP